MLESQNMRQQGMGLTAGMATSPISYGDALENYRNNTDWWIIFDCFDLPNAVGSALWISGRTGLSVDIVTEALEGLITLGLVARTSKGFEKIKSEIVLPHENQSKQERMLKHALISRQVLNHLQENAKGALRFASFASNLQIIAEMYDKIDKAILEADEQSKKLPRNQIDNVYLMSFTAVTTTQSQDGKGSANV